MYWINYGFGFIKKTEVEEIPGILLLDFEKAFDSLEWLSSSRFLQYFGFGPSIA